MSDFLQAVLEAHKHSSNHRAEIERSALCVCFYCLKSYEPSKIVDWVDDGDTALCPRCGIDSVFGSASGYRTDIDFLRMMKRQWFGAGLPAQK